MSESEKIYFISDIHLGAPALKNNRERELRFAQWLDFIDDDVAELYLLGDIFDFWFEYKKVVPRRFTRILGRLANLTDRGIPVHFFTGNHDLWVFGYLREETGLIIHYEELVTELGGKKFFLAHGDGLDPGEKGYLFLKKIFTSKKLQWLFARLHPNFAFYIAHKWSKSSRLSKKGREEQFNVKNENLYHFAKKYLDRECIDYFIFGHRHKMAEVDLKNNSKMILLGDWIKSYSYAVYDGEKLNLKIFDRKIS